MDGEVVNGLMGEMAQDLNATENEVEKLLMGFLEALIAEQTKGADESRRFSQILLPSEEIAEPLDAGVAQ